MAKEEIQTVKVVDQTSAKAPDINAAQANSADQVEASRAKALDRQKKAAQEATDLAAEENRLPANTAVTNPAPGTQMNPSSGVFVEPAILQGIPADHPSVENNPRKATSAVQNGQDFNDPTSRNPADPKFKGEGLDLSVYGKR